MQKVQLMISHSSVVDGVQCHAPHHHSAKESLQWERMANVSGVATWPVPSLARHILHVTGAGPLTWKASRWRLARTVEVKEIHRAVTIFAILHVTMVFSECLSCLEMAE